MSNIIMQYGKSYFITVRSIEVRAVYKGSGWFETIQDKYHISEITSVREV